MKKGKLAARRGARGLHGRCRWRGCHRVQQTSDNIHVHDLGRGRLGVDAHPDGDGDDDGHDDRDSGVPDTGDDAARRQRRPRRGRSRRSGRSTPIVADNAADDAGCNVFDKCPGFDGGGIAAQGCDAPFKRCVSWCARGLGRSRSPLPLRDDGDERVGAQSHLHVRRLQRRQRGRVLERGGRRRPPVRHGARALHRGERARLHLPAEHGPRRGVQRLLRRGRRHRGVPARRRRMRRHGRRRHRRLALHDGPRALPRPQAADLDAGAKLFVCGDRTRRS